MEICPQKSEDLFPPYKKKRKSVARKKYLPAWKIYLRSSLALRQYLRKQTQSHQRRNCRHRNCQRPSRQIEIASVLQAQTTPSLPSKLSHSVILSPSLTQTSSTNSSYLASNLPKVLPTTALREKSSITSTQTSIVQLGLS